MKLYQTIDGTMIGFYKDKGAEVQALLYRDIYEKQMVTKTREEEQTIPGYYETVEIPVPGYWKEERVYVQGHYERQMIWKPAYTVTRYRTVTGYWEVRTQWIPGYWETYWVTRPADPVTGRIAVTYEDKRWIPGYEYHRKVWVPPYTEQYEVTIPAGESMGRVWVEGHYETDKTWIPATTTTEKVWIPPEKKMVTVKYEVLEDVWIGMEPVYEMVDPEKNRVFEVLELIEAPADRPDLEDSITIRNMLTNEVLTTTAYYMGMAQQIDENEYVVP